MAKTHSVRVDDESYGKIVKIVERDRYLTISGVLKLAIDLLAKKKKIGVGEDGDK